MSDPSPEPTIETTPTPAPSPSPIASAVPCPVPVQGPVLSCGTATIKGTTSFDLEGGKPAAPDAADIWWQQIDATHRYMVPENGAGLYNVGLLDLASVTLPNLQAATFSQVRIRGTRSAPSGTIGVNSVVAVRTRNGHYAKLRVDVYGWDLGVTWVTFASG